MCVCVCGYVCMCARACVVGALRNIVYLINQTDRVMGQGSVVVRVSLVTQDLVQQSFTISVLGVSVTRTHCVFLVDVVAAFVVLGFVQYSQHLPRSGAPHPTQPCVQKPKAVSPTPPIVPGEFKRRALEKVRAMFSGRKAFLGVRCSSWTTTRIHPWVQHVPFLQQPLRHQRSSV